MHRRVGAGAGPSRGSPVSMYAIFSSLQTSLQFSTLYCR